MSLKLTIGTAPCSWGVWWPDGTPSGVDYKTYLSQAQEAGYKTMELGPIGYLPTEKEALLKELSDHGLTLCGGTACFDFLSANSFKDIKARVDDICKRIVSFDTYELITMDENFLTHKKRATLDDAQKRVYDIFEEMGKYCKSEYGVRLLMHPERCSLIATKEDLVNLINRGLDICLDNGHYVATNGSYEMNDTSSFEFMREYRSSIPYLHFKNIDSEIRRKEMLGEIAEDDEKMDDMMCELVDGIINYADYFKLLDELNFEGVAIIEQDCPHDTADQAFGKAKRNLNYINELLKKY